jgi:hypothetical protein
LSQRTDRNPDQRRLLSPNAAVRFSTTDSPWFATHARRAITPESKRIVIGFFFVTDTDFRTNRRL